MQGFHMLTVREDERAMSFIHEGVRWVTNGHWMARADYVAFNKKLRQRIAEVTTPEAWQGNANTQGPLGNFNGVSTCVQMLKNCEGAVKLRWLPLRLDDRENEVDLLATLAGDQLYAVQARYVAPFGELNPWLGPHHNPDVSQSLPSLRFLDEYGQLEAIVMPLVGVEDVLEMNEANLLAKALASAGFPKP